jgi:PadR family transcriptional regulator PadR
MARERQPSKQMLGLLRVLCARAPEWSHGYDLMKATGILSGTLYPLLMRMTDQALVEAEWRAPSQPGRPARHAYRLTAKGLALAREVADSQSAPDRKARFS